MAYAPEWEVCVWKIRFREKWNMVKMNPKIGLVDAGVRQIIDGNQIQDGCRSGHVG
jgi:hypothetical protein